MNKFLHGHVLAAGLLFFSSILTVAAQKSVPLYLDDSKPLEQRVEDALSRMTLREKIAIIHAQSKFSSPGVPRLGIPENWMSDGPHGIRAEVMWDEWYGADWTNDSCTAFPALSCLAATWNPDMALLYGKSIGAEARYRNKNVLLGPGMNIYRTPLGGRNFEFMGEDPYLASMMSVPYVIGVQENGVAACPKHFALNNQEKYRDKINVIVDDRALNEIYLPAFKAVVQNGHAWAIMGAYNQYKNEFCCHNNYLLNDLLKKQWGFDGVVVSDWGGTHNTEQAVKNGLDMEFGSWTNGLNWGRSNAYDNYYLAEPYLKLIEEGKVGTQELDDKVRRVLRLSFRTTMNRQRPFGSFSTEEHALAGRKIAEEGIVLLKNTAGLLPVDVNSTKKILVVGENAVKRMTVGGGSSSLKARFEISPLEGIRRLASDKAEVTFVQGYASPAQKEQDVKDAKEPRKKKINYENLRNEAVRAAKEADVVLFVGGLNKNWGQDCEGTDRESMDLPYHQNELIEALTAANPRTVVILVSGNAVSMPWVKNVPAIVQAWYNGSEAGNALADILFGKANPSGKLPFTFPVRLQDNPAVALKAYPGDGKNVTYKEGIFVGYRYTEKNNIHPLFPFGYGLSYTTFKYGKTTIDKSVVTSTDSVTIHVPVTNVGNREGKEIVQLYIQDVKSSLPRPVKELKGFYKVDLQPGETKTVTFKIGKDALSYYDDRQQKWVAEPGKFNAFTASSSQEIKGKVSFVLQ